MGIYLVDCGSVGLGSRFHLNHFDINYLPKEARTKALDESSQKRGRSVGERSRGDTFVSPSYPYDCGISSMSAIGILSLTISLKARPTVCIHRLARQQPRKTPKGPVVTLNGKVSYGSSVACRQ